MSWVRRRRRAEYSSKRRKIKTGGNEGHYIIYLPMHTCSALGISVLDDFYREAGGVYRSNANFMCIQLSANHSVCQNILMKGVQHVAL